MTKIYIFVIIFFVFVFLMSNSDKNITEHFANDLPTTPFPTTVADLRNLIYELYKIDVQAIKNLVFIAQQLQTGGITVPSVLKVKDQIQVSAEDPANKLRVGSAWKYPGIYSENDRDIIVGSANNVFLGKCNGDRSFSSGLTINKDGNAKFTGKLECGELTSGNLKCGTVECGAITSTTITSLNTTIADFEKRIKALEGKTKNITTDGDTTTTFSGAVYAKGIKDTNNGTQFGLGYNKQNQIFGEYTWLKGQFVHDGGIIHPCRSSTAGC